MQNRITFSNVIGVLLENKKKTYAQYRMIEDIFFDCLSNMDLFEKDDFEKNVTYSRWCTGDRPIPKEILGSTKNVDEFVAAAGFSAGDMDYASVLITLKYNFKKDDGFNDSRYISLFIRKINGKEQTLDVETLGYEKLGEISLR